MVEKGLTWRKGGCHCGAVRFAVETAPEDVTDCNCSICRRSGTLWAYYQAPEVRFAAENGPTDSYVWGDRMLELHRCRTCGCVTHWAPVDEHSDRMGVNARLMDPHILRPLRVRKLDGALTGKYLR